MTGEDNPAEHDIPALAGALRTQVDRLREDLKLYVPTKTYVPDRRRNALRQATNTLLAAVALLGVWIGHTSTERGVTNTDRIEQVAMNNSCALRGILELAQTASTRNPLPPGLSPEQQATIESQRARATEFYSRALSLVADYPCPRTADLTNTTSTGAP